MLRRVVLLVLFASGIASADPVLVERVVARVDGKPIYLSEIRARSRPTLASLGPTQRASAFRATHRSLLEQRIERELLLARARRERVEVTPDEVTQALESIARSNHIDVEGLLAEATRTGFDASAYRQEIAEQLLEQRLVQTYGMRHLGAYPVSDAARTRWMARARARLLHEARRQTWVERWVRW